MDTFLTSNHNNVYLNEAESASYSVDIEQYFLDYCLPLLLE